MPLSPTIDPPHRTGGLPRAPGSGTPPLGPHRRVWLLRRHVTSLLAVLGALLGLGLGPTPAAHAQVAPERFFAAPLVRDALLSPSGTQLAVTTARGGTRVGLVLIDLQDLSKPPRRLGGFEDVDIVGLHWMGEDWLLFSVTDLDASGGAAQQTGAGLYVVNTDGQDLRNLIRRRSFFVVEASPLARRGLETWWRLLKVPAPGPGVNPDEIIVGEARRAEDHVQTVPMWLNVRTMRTRQGDLKAPEGGAAAWLFDSFGKPRAAVTVHGLKRWVHVRLPGQDHWKPLTEQPVADEGIQLHSIDDNGQMLVTQFEGPQQRRVLKRWDADKNAPSAESWVRVDGFDFRGEVLREGTGAQQRMLGIRVEGETQHTVWFDEDMKALQQEADARWPGRLNRLSCRRCAEPQAVVLLHSHSDRDPGELWLWRAATREWVRVARVMPDIDPADMAQVDFRRIAARDGRELPLWMTLPKGWAPGQARPTVVLVHGGPWVRGGFWRWEPLAQYLAAQGWVVLVPDFRGSAGYGQAHLRAGDRQWGRAMQDDVADALLWARQQKIAHPERACIIGASYGGYASLMGLVQHPSLYRCGASWVGVTDLMLLLQGHWWVDDDISDLARGESLKRTVGDAASDADALRQVSPVEQAARIQAPVLLAWGGRDRRVPPAHGERMREALQKAGVPHEVVVYEDEAHGWRKPANQVDFAKRLVGFLGRYLDEGKGQ
jgi:dipeptidyl aminopeptidase/acylaminoacyl peptidase